ncbi:MAG TPA: hypothetical protein VGI70_13200, partial [Polyangiales bacterium]
MFLAALGETQQLRDALALLHPADEYFAVNVALDLTVIGDGFEIRERVDAIDHRIGARRPARRILLQERHQQRIELGGHWLGIGLLHEL